MKRNIFFWGAKYKAGIIHDFINTHKLKENTKNLFVKYLFDPGLKSAQFKSKAIFSNKKENLEQFLKKSHYFVTCIGNDFGMARYFISKELAMLPDFTSSIFTTSAVSNKDSL